MKRRSSHFQHNEPAAELLLRKIRFQIASKYISKNSIVADLGCGYHGEFLNKISYKIKAGSGFDFSIAKKTNFHNIKLIKCDLNKEIKNNRVRFDYVVALAVLEHVKNPDSFIKMCRKILKKSGKLIITTPHSRSKKILEFLSYKLNFVSKDEIHDHKNYFTESTLRNILTKNKLKIKTLTTFEFGYNILCVSNK